MKARRRDGVGVSLRSAREMRSRAVKYIIKTSLATIAGDYISRGTTQFPSRYDGWSFAATDDPRRLATEIKKEYIYIYIYTAWNNTFTDPLSALIGPASPPCAFIIIDDVVIANSYRTRVWINKVARVYRDDAAIFAHSLVTVKCVTKFLARHIKKVK